MCHFELSEESYPRTKTNVYCLPRSQSLWVSCIK